MEKSGPFIACETVKLNDSIAPKLPAIVPDRNFASIANIRSLLQFVILNFAF